MIAAMTATRTTRGPRLRVTDGTNHPVTESRVPVINCQQCMAPLPVRPGRTASQVLTAHYNDLRHGEDLLAWET